MTLPVELCALCGRAIPYFSAAASESDQELSVFDTMADGRAAHGSCLDAAPLFGWAVGPARKHAPGFRFFLGLHQPHDAAHFSAAFISVNRLRKRRGPFAVGDWIMDSGAFTEVSTHGGYRTSVEDYAAEIRRWSRNGNLLAAVAQDWMCEPWIVRKTGLSVAEHQRRTIERYDQLVACDTGGVYVMPVLQGYAPSEYLDHLDAYGDRLGHGAWVGVGSICKRNANPAAILRVLMAIKTQRPDLRIHGFGLKTTALASPEIRALLHTADSMAWSFTARREGRGPQANDWREARRWLDRLEEVSRTARPREVAA